LNVTPARTTALAPDEVSLVAVLNAVLRHLTLLVLFSALGVLIGVSAALLATPTFVATASFISHSQSQAPLRGGSLLEGLGLTVAGGGRSPEFYLALLQSREALRAAATSTYGHSEPGVEPGPLSRFVDDFRARDGLEAAVDWLRDAIVVSADGRTGLMTLEVAAPHAFLAEEVAVRLLTSLNEAAADIQQGHAALEAAFINDQLAAARDSLFSAERALGAFLERNREFRNAPNLELEYEQLQRRVGNQNRLVGSLQESYYQARIQALRNIPTVALVDPPEDSARRRGGSPVLGGVLGLIMGAIAALILVALLEFGRRVRTQDPENYQEFVRLSASVRSGLMNPWRRSR
jgi:uncharacterized protein involved in exopolysaccharide biosynthesis